MLEVILLSTLVLGVALGLAIGWLGGQRQVMRLYDAIAQRVEDGR